MSSRYLTQPMYFVNNPSKSAVMHIHNFIGPHPNFTLSDDVTKLNYNHVDDTFTYADDDGVHALKIQISSTEKK